MSHSINIDSAFVSIGAAKITQMRGDIRWLRRADGSVTLQIAQTWEQGSERGFDWIDVPTVDEEDL